jgi:hypothetical protein
MTYFDDHGFPIVNLSNDGWSNEDEATATCFCGSVQLILVSLSFYTPSSSDDFDHPVVVPTSRA